MCMEELKMFSKRLIVLLKENKLTQKDLSEKLGLSAAAINKWTKSEGGMPDYDNLFKLRKIFNVSADYLLGYDLKDVMESMTSCNYAEIAKKIKNIRESKNLTQKEFAIFNDMKVKDIEDVESGKPVNVEILKNIAFFSGINFYELMGQERKPTTTADTEYKDILKFAANMENIDYIKLAVKIKESGVSLEDVIVSRKI